MKLVLLVLNKVEVLDELLIELNAMGLKGGTLLNSTGLEHVLATHNDFPLFGTIRMTLDPELQESKTFFTVVSDNEAEDVKKVIRNVVGDLSKPNTAVIFTLPVIEAEGTCI